MLSFTHTDSMAYFLRFPLKKKTVDLQQTWVAMGLGMCWIKAINSTPECSSATNPLTTIQLRHKSSRFRVCIPSHSENDDNLAQHGSATTNAGFPRLSSHLVGGVMRWHQGLSPISYIQSSLTADTLLITSDRSSLDCNNSAVSQMLTYTPQLLTFVQIMSLVSGENFRASSITSEEGQWTCHR